MAACVTVEQGTVQVGTASLVAAYCFPQAPPFELEKMTFNVCHVRTVTEIK